MIQKFSEKLLDESTKVFFQSGRFSYHFSRGKLKGDPIFREILRRGLLTRGGRLLDLGCGQASLFAWLLASRRLFEQGYWPDDWPEAPLFEHLRGVELMQNDVTRAHLAFGSDHPVVKVERADMKDVDFGCVDVVTILDALHYFEFEQQVQVLKRIHQALPAGGLFLTRIGDADAGFPFLISKWVDTVVTFARGHRLPSLYCRSLSDWKQILTSIGFDVESDRMSEGKPFANVMLVCRVPL
jgi:cyclopropane fatty-acyl-phospholipid synthase-like methyltransferase